jgi:fibronectin type 3 domain-containing protein
LQWTVPKDGGSAITGYRIYRGASSGSETFLTSVGNVTSYKDAGTERGRVYYYKVSAVNAVGEGPKSNEASAKAT